VDQDHSLPPDAAGIHQDKDNQPFALVLFTENWPLNASHEALEMLVDPSGDKLVAGNSPKPDQGRVEFLVEVCDPCEAVEFGYTVNGILVSDFYTPQYFDPVPAAGVRYSFTGALTSPRQVLPGGYLSWHDPVSDDWWQDSFLQEGRQFRKLGRLSGRNASLRVQLDRLTGPESLQAMVRNRQRAAQALEAYERMISRPSANKAGRWLEQIDRLRG
jgi:hypothetical protein